MTEISSNGFFKVTCHDLARIVSIMSLESTDISKPRSLNSFLRNFYEKLLFFIRFFYLVFIKGFTPTIFDLLPFSIWYSITMFVYIYRATILPFILRLTGYGKYANWNEPPVGFYQPKKNSIEAKQLKVISLCKKNNLSKVDFGDPDFEKFIHVLYQKQTHLSPHSQSPGHPLVLGFPGNFFNHLVGVYKILVAWKQPRHVIRGGFFHSVYGTFDYRAGCFDLRQGRTELRDLIGPGAEELAFCICTSDRLGMLQDLNYEMYGIKTIPIKAKSESKNEYDINEDGNPLPELKSKLSPNGFPVRNHITQKYSNFPPELFAQFIVVVCADFMEQGALPSGAVHDMDLCLFHFLRFRYFIDLIRYVSSYLYVIPPILQEYFLDKSFKEPTRKEIQLIIDIWRNVVQNKINNKDTNNHIYFLTDREKYLLVEILNKCPYLIEPHVILACGLEDGEEFEGLTKQILSKKGISLIEKWGMMCYKKTSMKDVLDLLEDMLDDESTNHQEKQMDTKKKNK